MTQWRGLAKARDGDGGPLAVAIADDARERLGSARTPEDRRRLEEALESATVTLAVGRDQQPGVARVRARIAAGGSWAGAANRGSRSDACSSSPIAPVARDGAGADERLALTVRSKK